MKSRIVTSFCIALCAVAFTSQAADKFWTGQGTTSNWSEGANWGEGAAPVAGDRLFFTVGSGSVNDLGDTPFDSLAAMVGVAFAGAPINLTGDTPIVVRPGATATFNAGVKVAGGRINIVGGRANMLGPITSDGACTMALDMQGALLATDNRCEIESTTKSLVVRSGAALGPSRVTITRGVLVVGDPTLPGIRVNNPISMRGLDGSAAVIQAFAASGSVDFAGPIDMDGDIRFSAAANADIRTSIGGLGKLTLDVADGAVLTLSGVVSPHAGLEIAHGVVRVAASNTLFEDDLAIDAGARLALGGFVKSVAALRCAGDLEIAPGTGLLTVNKPSSLRGCFLDLAAPARFANAGSGEITLIRNRSGEPLDGTFVGLPEGAVLVDADGVRAKLTYRGGTGADATLIVGGGATVPLVQDMWWSGPQENGWGMSLVQHGATLFGALYVYDASGKPTWLVMPGGSWNAEYTVFTGSLYAPHGSPFFAYDARQLAVGDAVGSATITFADPAHAILEYSANGASGRKAITRQVFATAAATLTDRSDLWWGGASQAGWGISLLQQGDTLFGVWYTYDASGAPTWFVLPGGAWTSPGVYEGHLYRTTGSPWIGRQYDASLLGAVDSGTYRLTFSGDAATFAYTADGHSGTLSITRQPF